MCVLDFAVAAPFYEIGVVYIYRGSPWGLRSTKASQVQLIPLYYLFLCLLNYSISLLLCCYSACNIWAEALSVHEHWC